MRIDRRTWLRAIVASTAGAAMTSRLRADDPQPPLKITGLRITPIALPDPPLLAASGCHGPYFLRTIIQLECEGNLVGIGETYGGQRTVEALEKARPLVVGQNAFAYRALARSLQSFALPVYAGIELACLDVAGKATRRRLCELLGGPVRNEVEFCAYIFYRYAADNQRLLTDRRIVDRRGRGKDALNDWGEVRTPEAMVRMAVRWQQRWGFRTFKLKAGVLPPKVELETMQALNDRFEGKCPLRIDPNASWALDTAIAAGKQPEKLNLAYYEDPVGGQKPMAEVRRATGLAMSTNMCVTRFDHIKEAVQVQPIDVLLCDHHYFGGIPACQELGRICDAVGWKLSQHSNNHAGVTMAAMIHVGAVTPQLTIASDTHYPWLPDNADIIQGSKLAIRDAKMQIPRGPGLGVSLDMDKVSRAAEIYRKCGMRDRDDAFTMRLVEPGWKRELY